MQYFNIYEAKMNLSRLVREVEQGEEVVIQRDGKPVAKLVPIRTAPPRQPGMWAGQAVIRPEFFEPLSEAEIAAFEGGD